MRTPGDRRGVKSATGRWIVTANYGAGSVGLVVTIVLVTAALAVDFLAPLFL